MAMFQTGNKRMHYELHANFVPEDTLFIHGNLASNNWWRPTIDLLRSRFRGSGAVGSLATAEWVGCGQSSAPSGLEDLKIESLARDYIALAKGLGISDVNLVGHSTGGLIALQAALIEPELFRRIVLLDPVAASGIQFGPEMYETFTKMSQDRAFCDSILISMIHQADVNSPLIKQLCADAFGVDRAIWHGVPDALKAIDLRNQLPSIRQPVLVLFGELDQVLPVAGAQEIAAKVANGEFVELKSQGHSCNVENPTKFVDLLVEFLYDD